MSGNKNLQNKVEVVFLIGAARSGTKLLRTILSQSESIGAIPYDMNYIWKYGHYDIAHDEISDIVPKNDEIKFIRNFIFKQAKKQNVSIIIEKTVANTLRIEYIKKVFPKAKIIHLYRDGRDVTLSAKQRWEGSIFDQELQSKKDIIKKVIDLPIIAVFPYIIEYAKNNLKHLLSKNSDQIEVWGPVYKGMLDDKSKYDLLTLCSLQWKKSVNRALDSLEKYEKNIDYIDIRYEDLVADPIEQIEKLGDFLNINDIDKLKTYATENIKQTSKQKWKKEEKEKIEQIEQTIKPELMKLGYMNEWIHKNKEKDNANSLS